MNGAELRAILLEALPRLELSRDELRDLDAAIGDGDLGITVGDGSAAARAALLALPDDRPVGAILFAIAPAVARANPSTFAGLVATALLAAYRSLGEREDVDFEAGLTAARAGADAIAARGKAVLGDKTLLDALVPSLEAAAAHPEAPLAAALEAARAGVEATRALTSQRGRAAWLGERTQGHADPGATAYLRLLEVLAAVTTTKDAGEQS
ncbi:MAG TPA: DAK2 domain-containing protein [Thermoleophilia bacterium]|jgi:dihydroxyacetone kinase-like protein